MMSKQEAANEKNQNATNEQKEEQKAPFTKRLAEGANNIKDDRTGA